MNSFTLALPQTRVPSTARVWAFGEPAAPLPAFLLGRNKDPQTPLPSPDGSGSSTEHGALQAGLTVLGVGGGCGGALWRRLGEGAQWLHCPRECLGTEEVEWLGLTPGGSITSGPVACFFSVSGLTL